jgi:hypothetical protein
MLHRLTCAAYWGAFQTQCDWVNKMSDEAAITINGTHLSEEQSTIIRMAVEAFAVVMAQGIEEQDEGVMEALTEPYVQALTSVQRLLDIIPGSRVQ